MENGHDIWNLECEESVGQGYWRQLQEKYCTIGYIFWEYRRSDCTRDARTSSILCPFFPLGEKDLK